MEVGDSSIFLFCVHFSLVAWLLKSIRVCPDVQQEVHGLHCTFQTLP